MRDITNSKGKIFRHFKGDLYLVEDFVTHSETQEKMVLYRALYGNCGLFVRPFFTKIDNIFFICLFCPITFLVTFLYISYTFIVNDCVNDSSS